VAQPRRSRNNLSHSNKERDAGLAEKIFWSALGHLQTLQPGFARGNRGKGVPGVSGASFMWLIPSPFNWSPPAWTGQNTGGARRLQSATCA